MFRSPTLLLLAALLLLHAGSARARSAAAAPSPTTATGQQTLMRHPDTAKRNPTHRPRSTSHKTRLCKRCRAGSRCPGNSFCFSGRCVTLETSVATRCHARRNRPTCAPCRSRRDCRSRRCRAGRCAPSSAGKRNVPTDSALRRVCPRFRGRLAECEICRRDYDCATGRCFRMRCVRDSRKYLHSCFFPLRRRVPGTADEGGDGGVACAPCGSDKECESRMCRAGKCDDRSARTMRMCFREECSRCGQNWQCLYGFCKSGRCDRGPSTNCAGDRDVSGSGDSDSESKKKDEKMMKKEKKKKDSDRTEPRDMTDMDTRKPTTLTTLPRRAAGVPAGTLSECAACKTSAVCATGVCTRGKCVTLDAAGLQRCFPRGYALPECAPCASDDMCTQGMCWGGRCTDGERASLDRCFLRECMECVASTQCASKLCEDGMCVYNSTKSRRTCKEKMGL